MISFSQAIERILEEVRTLPECEVLLMNALGRSFSRSVESPRNLPPMDNSAMDGFAVRAQDTGSGGLRIVGEVPAGPAGGEAVGVATAIRVMTGGEIPSGADAVVPIEMTELDLNGILHVRGSVHEGDHIRRIGEDLRTGDTVFDVGTTISPAEIGMLAALGQASIWANGAPRVSILPTGNELREPSADVNPLAIFNSNGPMLAALFQRDGACVSQFPIAKDEPSALRKALEEALDCDVLLTSGGVSMGKYDFIPETLESLGVRIVFHKVAIKPGKPILFGVKETPRRTLIFGLPGNPVSTYVTYELFVRPALRALAGHGAPLRSRRWVKLAEPFHKKPGLTHFVRATIEERPDGTWARPTGPQGSHLLTSLTKADGLLVFPDEVEALEVGERAEFISLRG